MNVSSPDWARFLPTRQPLTSGLRVAFHPERDLPSEFQKLLQRLERGASRRRADND